LAAIWLAMSTAEFPGFGLQVLTSIDVARLEADDADRESLRAAVVRRNQIRADRAETEAARCATSAR